MRRKEFENKSYKGQAIVIEGANPKTFSRTDWDWAKDGKYHFYKNVAVPADYNSFEKVTDNFIKDKDQVFFLQNKSFQPILATPASFKGIDKRLHAMDATRVYWVFYVKKKGMSYLTIPHDNTKEVKVLSTHFLRIGNAIYYDGILKRNMDGSSFEVIDHSYAKDAKQVYYKDQIVSGADPASFRKLKESYTFVDKNGTYEKGKRVAKKEQETTQ